MYRGVFCGLCVVLRDQSLNLKLVARGVGFKSASQTRSLNGLATSYATLNPKPKTPVILTGLGPVPEAAPDIDALHDERSQTLTMHEKKLSAGQIGFLGRQPLPDMQGLA